MVYLLLRRCFAAVARIPRSESGQDHRGRGARPHRNSSNPRL